ncbi:hypothetical protein [Pontibacter pamirensis]|uniref:hypothetical protein n=1 Tax=Pontibacter pamirensis TaxID=2562824 RepID=UPI00138A3F70|nr:hypothetical protein [Pontibacter pamirensis]
MKFYRDLAIITAVLCVVIGALLQFTGYALVHPLIWYTLLFFIFITGFTYYLIELGNKNDPGSLHVYYLASMGFRMVLSIGVVLLYVYFFKENRLMFVFNFFALYFLFTGFEVYSLLSNLRPNLKKQN